MIRAMVDIETLGKHENATIVSIGALTFGPGQPQSNHFYRRVDLNQGRKIDPGTVVWWFGQSEEAQREIAGGGRLTLDSALQELAAWFARVQPRQVWAKEPDFDLAILRNAYEQLGLPLPWKYYAARAVRTQMDNIHYRKHLKASHHALFDCQVQAVNVCRSFARAGVR
jgi:exodeoxyribonuclease VIII